MTTDSEFRFLGYTVPPGPPCRSGQPAALLDQWRKWVDEYRPQVVIYLSRVDLMNQQLDGTWTSIGQPAFDRFLHSQLRLGVSILGSLGARVVLLTSPYYYSSIEQGGPAVPEDTPGRVSLDDRILEQVTAGGAEVSLFPLGNLVSPGGRYAQDVHGVDVRCGDGVHFSALAGSVIAPRLLPLLVHLAGTAHVPVSVPDPPLPPVTPHWYDQLQCGQG